MSLKSPSQPSTLHDQGAPILVEFEDEDPRNPIYFSTSKKWCITITACAFTGITAGAISAYSMGVPTMVQDLHTTTLLASVGLSVYPLGFGILPLFSSSLSEEFGRFPLYIVTAFLFVLTHAMIALAPNIQTVIVGRFFSGAFGSTGATLVAGTIADIWRPNERGIPMALYSISAMGATGLGPLLAGWIDANPHLGWRWIHWITAIVSGVIFLFVVFLLPETRGGVILTRLAREMRQTKQDSRYHSKAEIDRRSLLTLIRISCFRPIKLLLTEPTVLSFSIWIGFAWGVLFCFMDSVAGEMKTIYHFSIGDCGSAYVSITIGSVLGWFVNLYQEVLYKKYVVKKGPEARLCLALLAAFLLPGGMLIYAWTARPSVFWIVPLIGLTIFIAGTFILYQGVFIYVADCYGPYASSALAGQSLCRNLLGTAFPLFTQQMYDKLTYKWANTLFALIAVAMIPIPFVLFFYGEAIRRRSKVSRKILALMEEKSTLELVVGKAEKV